jgi:hypothetical protein
MAFDILSEREYRGAKVKITVHEIPKRRGNPKLNQWWKASGDRCGSLQNLIFERHPFGVVLLEPFSRGVDIREHP